MTHYKRVQQSIPAARVHDEHVPRISQGLPTKTERTGLAVIAGTVHRQVANIEVVTAHAVPFKEMKIPDASQGRTAAVVVLLIRRQER
jgi:hypothetical protein